MNALMTLLKKLQAQNVIRSLDYQFAKFVFQQGSGDMAQYEAWLAAIVSYELGHGHICFPVVDHQGSVFTNRLPFGVSSEGIESYLEMLNQADWEQIIRDSAVIGTPGDKTPLIFDGKRLYLHRYWFYESVLAQKLIRFGQEKMTAENKVRVKELRESLDRLFSRSYAYLLGALEQCDRQNDNLIRRVICESLDIVDEDAIDWAAVTDLARGATTASDLNDLDDLIPQSTTLNWQKVAAAVAISQSFAVISGGPGTGKTTTVAKLLAALVEASHGQSSVPVIKLVAPTGKAAARLTESIGTAIESLPVAPNVRDNIPTQAGTIHRLLGAIPNRANFRHNKENPLHLDILIIDEASMVDLSLMYKLFEALPAHAKVILLGDKDQLASVEAGAVLGDICSFQSCGYSAKQASMIEALTGFNADNLSGKSSVPSIADSLCMLQKSYRFNSRSGIGQLAKAVNSGDVNAVNTVLGAEYSDVHYFNLSAANYQMMVAKLISEYQTYLDIIAEPGESDVSHKAKSALKAFAKCRLLCAVREGDFGVSGINARIEKQLKAKKRIRFQDDTWYEGRPVMVVQNDHNLGVYNGDIGLCLNDHDGRLKVYFELADGTIKGVLPSRLPQHETAYAMTVHKSQGSEFETTILILPPDFSPIITRELIYTGITRAKETLYLLSSPTVLNRGTKLLTSRASGLKDLLA